MEERPLFQDADELERTYAPQQLPTEDQERERVRADEGADTGGASFQEPPDAAPVANLGTAPSAAAAPPNIGREDRGGAPGDPSTQARDPLAR